MTLVGRQGLQATDPVTPVKFVRQAERLNDALNARVVDADNFNSDSYQKIRQIVDSVNSSKYYEGHFLNKQADTSAISTYNLHMAVKGMLDLIAYDYTVVDQEFEFSLSTDGIKTKETKIGVGDVLSGVGTIAGMTGSGALAGSAFGPPGAIAGAIIGGTIGTATVLGTWIWGDRPEKEVGQEITEYNSVIIPVPFGFEYEDHSVTGFCQSSIADKDAIMPAVVKGGSDTDTLRFYVTSQNIGKLSSDEYFFFRGRIQVLLRRKI